MASRRKYQYGGSRTGANVGSAVGSLAGTFLPIPGGSVVGGLLGEGAGSLIGSLFGKRDTFNPQTFGSTHGPVMGTFAMGGSMKKISPGRAAMEFIGRKHESGGIDIGDDVEVEGGETMDFFAKGGKVYRKGGIPYIFSDRLKVPGRNITFAKAHKSLVKRGIGDEAISNLARMQERISGRSTNGKKMQFGGPTGMNTLLPYPDLPDIQLRGTSSPLGKGNDGGGIGGILGDINKKLFGEEDEELTKLDKALPYIPAAVGALGAIGYGLRKRKPIRIDNSRAESVLNKADLSYNINPQLNENTRQTLAIQRSPGATTNSRLAAHAENLRATQRLYGEKENVEGTRRLGIAESIARLKAATNESNSRYEAINRSNSDAKKKYILEGITGALTGVAANRATEISNKKREKRDTLALLVQLAGADEASRNRISSLLGLDSGSIFGGL